MSKWSLVFIAVATLAVASQTIVTAQIRQRSPLPQPTPLVPNTTSTPEPAKRRMPTPGTGETPVLKSAIRINPIQMYNLGGKPFLADTADGQVYYLYEGENLVEEHIGHGDEMITGRYTYDKDGRFEALTYSDGITISARYGNDGELLMLTSGSGRSIGFSYRRNDAGAIGVVTPTRNFLEFHSAVALLRLKRPPHWWPNAEPMDRVMDTKDKGGRTSSPDSGWPGVPEYPENPFPENPTTPDGTPVVEVSAPRPGPGGPPIPPNPVYNDGVDIIPTGGRGGAGPRGGGVIGDELDGLEQFDTRLALKKQCHSHCATLSRAINRRCRTGPTLQDKDACWSKLNNFEYHCAVGCETGDYHHEFRNRMRPEDLDFTPWDSPTKGRH